MANADTQAAGEWVAHSQAGYFMRADSTDAGRLVRVADVVRWLMYRKDKELPFTDAVAAACDALQQATPAPVLFYVDRAEYAKPVPENALFGFHTEATWAAAKAKQLQDALQREHEARDGSGRSGGFANPSGWRNNLEFRDGRIRARATKPQLVEPGFAAAVLCMRSTWTNSRDIEARLDSPKLAAAHLAVRLQDAAELWGFEGRTTPDLFEAVTAAADDSQIPNWLFALPAGAIAAVQFLALVLSVVAKDGATEDDERRIVAAWSKALADATAVLVGGARDVVPRDPVTMLPIPSRPASWDWLLAVDDADSFLERSGAGWRCSEMLDHWRQHYGSSSPRSTGEAGRMQPAGEHRHAEASNSSALPAHVKGKQWTPEQKVALAAWIEENGRGALAKAARHYGVEPSALHGALHPKGKGKPFPWGAAARPAAPGGKA